MARKPLASRLSIYMGTSSIDVIRLSVVGGQHTDTPLYTGIKALFNESSEIVIDGDLSQQALQTYTFRLNNVTQPDIKTGDIIIFNSNRYKIIASVPQLDPLSVLMITATKIEA